MSSRNNLSGSSLGRALDQSSRRDVDDSEDDDLSLFDDVIESATSKGRPNENRPGAPSRSANMSGSRLGERFRRTSGAPAATSNPPKKKGMMGKVGSIRNLWNPRGSAKEVDQSVNIMDLPYDPDAAARSKVNTGAGALQRSMVDIFLSDEASDPHLGSSLNWDYGDKKKSKKKCRTSSLIVLCILIIVIMVFTVPEKGVFPLRQSSKAENNNKKKPAPDRAPATRPPVEEVPADTETEPEPAASEPAQEAHESALENSMNEVPKNNRLDAIEHWILKQDVTDPDQLKKSGSPTKRAHHWLAKDDKAQLPIPGYDDMEFTSAREKEHQLLQRYALAVLYYSIEEGATTARTKADEGERNLRNLQAVTMAEELANREKFDSDWMTKANICDWHGVVCDNEKIYVTEIRLPGHLLQGTLPRELFVGTAMPYLKSLDLSKNEFTGTIPYSLAPKAEHHWPPSLQTFKVGSNQLTGYIDDMIELAKLREVDLSNNGFVGRIPVTIQNLSHLEILIFSANQLTSLGDGLDKLTDLKLLRLDSNQFHGTIPSALGAMTGLEELMLSSNYFTGTIPESLGDLEKMNLLLLDGNELQGFIPSSLGSMTSLERFQLDGNDLTGEMPKEVCQLRDDKLVFLQSDCADGNVVCDCCTDCY